MKKAKFTMYLEQDMIAWLHSETKPELSLSGVIRNLIRDKMDSKSGRKATSSTSGSYSFELSNKN